MPSKLGVVFPVPGINQIKGLLLYFDEMQNVM